MKRFRPAIANVLLATASFIHPAIHDSLFDVRK